MATSGAKNAFNPPCNSTPDKTVLEWQTDNYRKHPKQPVRVLSH